jgi:hypothetical protein
MSTIVSSEFYSSLYQALTAFRISYHGKKQPILHLLKAYIQSSTKVCDRNVLIVTLLCGTFSTVKHIFGSIQN